MTDIKVTFSTLNSYFLNTDSMRINKGYLNDSIILWAMNIEKFYNDIRYSKKKLTGVLFNVMVDFVNHHIKQDNYPYHQDKCCSSYQIKKWLDQYGDGWDTLNPALEYFENERKEAIEEGAR